MTEDCRDGQGRELDRRSYENGAKQEDESREKRSEVDDDGAIRTDSSSLPSTICHYELLNVWHFSPCWISEKQPTPFIERTREE